MPDKSKYTPDNAVLVIDDRFEGSNLTARRVVEARREQVAAAMLKGWTRDRIAEDLGVSSSTISYDMQEIRKSWRESAVEQVAEQAILDVARLDWLIAGHIDKAPYDAKSADIVIKAIQERASILGYRQGITFDVAEYIKDIATQNGYDVTRAIEIADRLSIKIK